MLVTYRNAHPRRPRRRRRLLVLERFYLRGPSAAACASELILLHVRGWCWRFVLAACAVDSDGIRARAGSNSVDRERGATEGELPSRLRHRFWCQGRIAPPKHPELAQTIGHALLGPRRQYTLNRSRPPGGQLTPSTDGGARQELQGIRRCALRFRILRIQASAPRRARPVSFTVRRLGIGTDWSPLHQSGRPNSRSQLVTADLISTIRAASPGCKSP